MRNLYDIAQGHKKILDSYLKSAKRKPDETINKAYDFVKQVANVYYKDSVDGFKLLFFNFCTSQVGI